MRLTARNAISSDRKATRLCNGVVSIDYRLARKCSAFAHSRDEMAKAYRLFDVARAMPVARSLFAPGASS